jgi:predicted transposase/invertase (TIGR01784 family)
LQIIENLFIAAKVAAMDSQEKINYLREMNTERDRRNQMQYQYDMGLEEGIERGRDKWIEVGVEKGIKIGIEQGIEQEAMRMAAKLKSLGIEMNIILESTGLTREQIEKL